MEFFVEERVETSGVAAYDRLVQIDLKRLKLAEKRCFWMLHWK